MEKLTKALQDLNDAEKRGIVPQDFPESLFPDRYEPSPEIRKFIEENSEYRERTKDANFGQY